MTKQPTVQIIAATEQSPDVVRMAPYVRVSSKSDEQLHSFHVQYNHYYDLINSKPGWQLVDVYADEGLTGTRADKRDEFNRLMRDCRAGKIDRIIVKSVSRFARNVADCLKYIRELKALGVSVIFEEEGIDTAEMTDETILSIRGVQAQHESTVISQNMRWSYQKRMQAGEFITCKAPIGYLLRDNTLVIDEKTAPVVKRIFAEYLNGVGPQKIADDLNSDGYQTAEHGAWSALAIRYILTNEKYTGNALLQKKYTTETLPFTKKRNCGEMPQYYITDSHEAIIPYADFQRAQELLDWRKQFYSGQQKGAVYPLSRKLICAKCGTAFKRKVTKNGLVIWKCARHDLKKALCPVENIRERDVYDAFIAMYNRLKLNRERILVPVYRSLEALYRTQSEAARELAELNSEIGKLSRQLTNMSGLFEKGKLSETLYVKNSRPLEQKIFDLRKARSSLLRKDEHAELSEVKKLLRVMQTGQDTLTGFNAILFENMVEKIIVCAENKLIFRLTGGLELTETIERKKRR